MAFRIVFTSALSSGSAAYERELPGLPRGKSDSPSLSAESGPAFAAEVGTEFRRLVGETIAAGKSSEHIQALGEYLQTIADYALHGRRERPHSLAAQLLCITGQRNFLDFDIDVSRVTGGVLATNVLDRYLNAQALSGLERAIHAASRDIPELSSILHAALQRTSSETQHRLGGLLVLEGMP